MLARTSSTETAAHSRLQIGEWWADPATNELGRAHETLRIEPKAMEVLMVLAGRPGVVASREELLSLARRISNDLMTDLSRLSGLRLISAFHAEHGTQTARSARYVVAGAVQRESETLRVNVRLIDARTNEQLWSERFERPFRDLFSVQDEIIRSLIERLPGKVSDASGSGSPSVIRAA